MAIQITTFFCNKEPWFAEKLLDKLVQKALRW